MAQAKQCYGPIRLGNICIFSVYIFSYSLAPFPYKYLVLQSRRGGKKKKPFKKTQKKFKRIPAFILIFWNCPILYGEHIESSVYLYRLYRSYRKIVSIDRSQMKGQQIMCFWSFHGGSFILNFLPYPVHYTVQWITWKQNKQRNPTDSNLVVFWERTGNWTKGEWTDVKLE